jgi:pimeloyl-ACP methyl ester carboxylesterase
MIFLVKANARIAIRACCAALVILAVNRLFPEADAQDALITHHDVSFISQGATLRGTLYLPNGTPFAAVVWVDGAGETKRNPGLGQFLAHRGLASLMYDKRGVGESGGIYAGPQVGTNNVSLENLSLLANDAAAALQSLRRDKTLRGVPLGFIGGSQAGWIIPLASVRNRSVRFMVLWSGAIETTHEDVLFEQLALPDPAFWDHHTHDGVGTIMANTEDHIAWPSFDPRDALSRLKIPGLWIFGGRDRNVDVDRSVARLKELIAAGHANYSYRMFPEYDHGLGGEREDVIDPSLDWIRAMVSRPPRRDLSEANHRQGPDLPDLRPEGR